MKANKVLGQHFLTSTLIVEHIVATSGVTKKDTVVEVGPGTGVLTAYLCKSAKRVIAIEKDARMVEFLKGKFLYASNLKIIHGDVLKPNTYNLIPKTSYKIVANIPYYITARFLRLTLEELERKPTSMTLMVQREVAERITAAPPHMNLLALSVQAFGTPKKLFSVSRGNFSPPPKVDSTVISILHISDDFFKRHKISQKEFFATARKAFSQKRKMLRSSLGIKNGFATKRPQELSPEDFVSLLKSDSNRDRVG